MLFLFTANFDEFTENVLFLPILLTIFFTVVVYALVFIILRKLDRTALITSFIVLVSLSYKRIFEPLNDKKLFGLELNQETTVLVIILLLLFLIIYLTFRFKNSLLSINKFITFIAVFLLGLTLVSFATSEIKSQRLLKSTPTSKSITTTKNVSSKDAPDIYYFIFDRYGGPKMLKEQYGFDNSKFINFLKDKGFYVAEDSTTNYPKTFLSLASSLNMEYVNYLTERTNGGESTDQSIVTPIIRNNKVLNYLKNKGYYTINMGSWWTPTSTNPSADRSFVMPNSMYPGADEFTSGFLNTTIAASALQKILKNPLNVSKNPKDNDHRQRIFYEFGQIPQIVKIQSPKFVFVHILIPHDPFVVDKNCQPISEKDVAKNPHQINYINQVQCANTNIESMLNTILANSKKPPIIIFQADEGPFPMNSSLSKDQAWSKVDDTALQEKFPILNAYYLPGKKDTQLYSSITPVNSFRVILNTYFGEKFPLIEDKNWIFADEKHYYKFIDVTDRVRNDPGLNFSSQAQK